MLIRLSFVLALFLLSFSACERAEVIKMYRVGGSWEVTQLEQSFLTNGVVDSSRSYNDVGGIVLNYQGSETATGFTNVDNNGSYSFRSEVPVSCTSELMIQGSINTRRQGTFTWISQDNRISCVVKGTFGFTNMLWTIEEQSPRRLQLLHVKILQNDSTATRQLVERMQLRLFD